MPVAGTPSQVGGPWALAESSSELPPAKSLEPAREKGTGLLAAEGTEERPTDERPHHAMGLSFPRWVWIP